MRKATWTTWHIHCNTGTGKTGRKVTFEYVIWRGINDDEKHARALARYCGRVPSKVNIIEYNPIDEGEFVQAAPEKIELYERILREKTSW